MHQQQPVSKFFSFLTVLIFKKKIKITVFPGIQKKERKMLNNLLLGELAYYREWIDYTKIELLLDLPKILRRFSSKISAYQLYLRLKIHPYT